jgi:hypothetical protein
MIMRSCEYCSADFEAKKVSARFCTASHRVAWNRAQNKAAAGTATATVLQLRPRTTAQPTHDDDGPAQGALPIPATRSTVPTTHTPSEPGERLSIEDHVRSELGSTCDTALGQMCLTLARRIDSGAVANSALSTAVARLDALLEKADQAGAVEEVEADDTNPITILQRRAAEKEAQQSAAG